MIKRIITDEYLVQNLKDAGCVPEFVEMCIDCYKQDENYEKLKRMLSKQRGLLLDDIHDSQRKLDCLDYLIYQLKK